MIVVLRSRAFLLCGEAIEEEGAMRRQMVFAIRTLMTGAAVALAASGWCAAAGQLQGGCTGGALGSAHNAPGVLCEDFDRDRNGNGTIDWTRSYLAASSCDPLAGVIDTTDDIVGHVTNGGPTPFGTDGQICSVDAGFAQAQLTCHVVASENDWHLHTPFEGCDPAYESNPAFASRCAPEARAHSGFRSLHLGRHLNATDTLGDTYRFRQVSAFVMDPVDLGNSASLEFWHILQVCDDK